MNEPIEKPIKRLAKDLLKDSEIVEGLIAVSFLPGGEVRAHGAGIVTQAPELALYGAARMIATLLGKYEPDNISGSLLISMQKGKADFIATGDMNVDPRAVIYSLMASLVEISRIVSEANNVTQDLPEVRDDG